MKARYPVGLMAAAVLCAAPADQCLSSLVGHSALAIDPYPLGADLWLSYVPPVPAPPAGYYALRGRDGVVRTLQFEQVDPNLTRIHLFELAPDSTYALLGHGVEVLYFRTARGPEPQRPVPQVGWSARFSLAEEASTCFAPGLYVAVEAVGLARADIVAWRLFDEGGRPLGTYLPPAATFWARPQSVYLGEVEEACVRIAALQADGTLTFMSHVECIPARPDAGSADAGAVDAGEADAGEADAGEADAGVADAGEPVDGGALGIQPAEDVGCACRAEASHGRSGPGWGLLALALPWLRRRRSTRA
ncbi:MAG: hypothetical protein KC933_19905 [Myxococcales bacterium]|nr:hypothetical protein [Myxococcales bacterium]MCB9645640.1 hypothetical protein [Deltaproteobacteria bacterium]